ncbi:MAG: metallophosphoesterase family protein [Clostridia bacterium]
MKKWMQKGSAILLAAALLTGPAVMAAAAAEDSQTDRLKIAVLSDTHYLSPSLIKGTADFEEQLNGGDRKMFAEGDAFLNAMLDTVQADDPDVLLISGDLTKDGERESHEALAAKLEQFEQQTGTQVYLVPGNHDLNNANATNFNTEDGAAVPATRTTQQDFREIYGDLVYDDDTVIASFTPAAGKQGGGLSYVARPKDGFTIIAIDSARYSADNTDSGTEEHETSGAVGPELESWIVSQVAAAKQRGDTVIGIQHHGVVAHFDMEPDLLPDFLVNDYERLAQVYADAGMSYIFTGHMHANDIAAVTTASGNTLYDIETGSLLTYPSPARAVTITRDIDGRTVNESMEIHTYTGVGPITFINPATGEEQTIEDISAYGKAQGFSSEALTNAANSFLHGYYDQIAATGSRAALENLIGSLLNGGQPLPINQALEIVLPMLITATEPTEGEDFSVYYRDGAVHIDWLGEDNGLRLLITTDGIADTLDYVFSTADQLMVEKSTLDRVIRDAVEEIAAVEVARDGDTAKTLLDYVNFIYQRHLGGEDSQEQPQWAQDARALLASGELTDQLIDLLIHHVSNLLNILLDEMDFTAFTGITGVTLEGGKAGLAVDPNRTPLLTVGNDHSDEILGFALMIAVCNWGTEIPDGYSMKDLLDNAGTLLESLGIGSINLDVESLLKDLINGTPDKEGLLTAELRGELTGFIERAADSMGTDSNYPEDNDTTITTAWQLPMDRTALDQAIAGAEAIDLERYTAETAQAVRDALDAAKALPLTATQAEIDSAAAALQNAVASLVEKTDSTTEPENPSDTTDPEEPDSDGAPSPDGNTTQTPDHTTQAPDSGAANTPDTGDSLAIPFTVMLLSGAVALALLRRKK